MRFPFVDLHAQYESIEDELSEAVLRTLRSQKFINGPEVADFEREIAAWNRSRQAIGCASGSDALLLALMALGIGPGDEVITTPFTFVATLTAILRVNASPVFVDIDPVTFNLDAGKLGPAISKRTKAIIPVHLYGLAADLDAIREFGVPVVEDAAQAIGAGYKGKKVGNHGAIGCFSFYPAKNLGAAGDAGMLTTNDEEIAERLRVLANHGSSKRYYYDVIGINSRLDSLQAALLRVKLRHLDEWISGRQAKAAAYAPLAEFVTLPQTPPDRTHAFNQFTIRTAHRDALRAYLAAEGLPSEIHYPKALHLHPAFAFLGYKEGDYPESERAAREVLSLPVFPELSSEHQQSIIDAVRLASVAQPALALRR